MKSFSACLILMFALLNSPAAFGSAEALTAFEQWVGEKGDTVYFGTNSTQSRVCVVRIFADEEGYNLAIDFRSENPEVVLGKKRGSSYNFSIPDTKFRFTTIEEDRLIQRGTFFTRVEVPLNPETLEILRFDVLDIFNKSYFNNCVGPFTKE